MPRKKLTVARVRQVLNYDPTTGVFTWASDRSKYKVGERAGFYSEATGQMHVTIDGTRYRLGHLAWAIIYGYFPHRVHYKDGDQTNLKIENLGYGLRPAKPIEMAEVECPKCGKRKKVEKRSLKVPISTDGPTLLVCYVCKRKAREERMNRAIQAGPCWIKKDKEGKRCGETELTCEHYSKCLDIASRGNWDGWRVVERVENFSPAEENVAMEECCG